MPAPYPRRDPTRGVARAVNRGSRGMAQGRFGGLAAVRGSTPVTRSAPASGIQPGGALYRTNALGTTGGTGIADNWWLWSTEGDALVARYSDFGQVFKATALADDFTPAGAYGQGPLLQLLEDGVYTLSVYAEAYLPAAGSMQLQVTTDAMDFVAPVVIVAAGPAGTYNATVTYPPWLNSGSVGGNTFRFNHLLTGVGAAAQMCYAAVARIG